MEQEDTKQINGLGRRVTDQSIAISKLEVKVDRNEQDIREVWVAITGIRCDTSSIKDSIAKVNINVAKTSGVISVITLICMYILNHFVK